jgi:hypothetical protein
MRFAMGNALVDNQELVTDLARFAEALVSEAAVRKKYRLQESDWVALGEDDAMVRAVEEERVRRIRSGALKRERAQLHVTKAPDVLEKIMMDPKANSRHRIDASKTFDDLAGFAPQAAAIDQDRVIIRIDLSADTKDPADVLVFEASARPNPNPNDAKLIDATPQPIPYQEEEVVPLRRGPGRPPGSKNKPKAEPSVKGVPGFILD